LSDATAGAGDQIATPAPVMNSVFCRNQEEVQMAQSQTTQTAQPQPEQGQAPKRLRNYTGEKLNVSYDAVRCIHAAECLRRLPTVFDNSRRPWVLPDNDAADKVITTVQACPSGALHYSRKDGGEAEVIREHNTIRLARNGPLHVRGDITILDSAGEVILHDTRVTLCRCGASSNKPFCDNSHRAVGFQAPLTIAEPQTIVDAADGGKLTIQTTHNGPLQITGNFTLLNSRGEAVYQGTDEAFCRCGVSADKPFCDDSHIRIGFVAEE
jgi:CDGSH-type Zn-finger protein/uncharacterized Fe-S cluster protein YjdI